MTAPALTKIYMTSITTMGLSYRMAQSILIGGNSNQMNVIGHQAVPPNVNRVLSAPMRHQFYIGLIVIVIEKFLLPSVAPLGNVVWIAGYHYSCNPIHDFGNIKIDHIGSVIKYSVPIIHKTFICHSMLLYSRLITGQLSAWLIDRNAVSDEQQDSIQQ
jgi:hypothetical protein